MRGPTTWPTLPTVKLRVLAAGTSSASTMRGMIAPRADDATAKVPDCSTTRPRMRPTLPTPSRVCASSAIVTSQAPRDDQR